MRARGALHVHSTLSHDGRLTLEQVASLYRGHGFHFVAIGEHSQDMSEEKVRRLVERCAQLSSVDFLMLPGIEYTCNRKGMHILGVGTLALTRETSGAPVARMIRQQGGFAVLAHPRRLGWQCEDEILSAVDAVEIWNVGYDGKYLPSFHARAGFRRMRAANPNLLAIASHDLHTEPGFYDVALTMELPSLTPDSILRGLGEGAYRIESRFFSTDAQFRCSGASAAVLGAFSRPLAYLRQARDLASRGPA